MNKYETIGFKYRCASCNTQLSLTEGTQNVKGENKEVVGETYLPRGQIILTCYVLPCPQCLAAQDLIEQSIDNILRIAKKNEPTNN